MEVGGGGQEKFKGTKRTKGAIHRARQVDQQMDRQVATDADAETQLY